MSQACSFTAQVFGSLELKSLGFIFQACRFRTQIFCAQDGAAKKEDYNRGSCTGIPTYSMQNFSALLAPRGRQLTPEQPRVKSRVPA